MAHKRVTYLNRLTMALGDIVATGLTMFTIPELVVRLKDQPLPPLGVQVLRRVHVLLVGEVKKGNIAVLNRKTGSYKFTRRGITTYREPVTSTHPNEVDDHSRGPLTDNTTTVSTTGGRLRIESMPAAVTSLLSLQSRVGKLNGIDISLMTSIPALPALSQKQEVLHILEALIPALNKLVDQHVLLQRVVDGISTRLTIGDHPLSALETAMCNDNAVWKKFIDFAQNAHMHCSEVVSLRKILVDWSPERLELMSQIEELSAKIDAVTIQ